MFTRHLTMIIITDQTLARVDLQGHRRWHVAGCWQRPMLDAASPAALVAAALKLAPRPATRIWVLNSELATAQISLPLEVSVLLGVGELEHALALEAEGQTGIAATSSRIGSIAVPSSACPIDQDGSRLSGNNPPNTDDEQYWITQVAETDLLAMQSAAQTLGAELVAIAHPHCIAFQEQAFHKQSSSSEPACFSLAVHDLAEQWANGLSQRGRWDRGLLPGAIYVNDAGHAKQSQMAVQLAACLLTASCLAGWAWYRHASLAELSRDIEVLEKRNADRDNAALQFKTAEVQLVRLRDEITRLKEDQAVFRRKLQLADQAHQRHQSHWCDLLDAMSFAAQEECWIQSWHVDKDEVVLCGLAIDQLSIHRFAARLDQKLQSSCWTVLPASTVQTDQQLISFSIVIQAQPTTAPVSSGDGSNAVVSNLNPLEQPKR